MVAVLLFSTVTVVSARFTRHFLVDFCHNHSSCLVTGRSSANLPIMGYFRDAFCLVHPSPDDFGRSQWNFSQVVYIYFRYLFAFYVIGWDILITTRRSYQYGGWFQVDLKAFSFHLLALYSFISVVSALLHWVKLAKWRYESFCQKQTTPSITVDAVINTSQSTLSHVGITPSVYRSNPWFFKLDWLLFNCNMIINPIVTILNWLPTAVQEGDFFKQEEDTLDNMITVHLTIVNTALIYLDLFVRRIPVRLIHSVYSMVIWVIFIVVNVVVHVKLQSDSNRPDEFLYPFFFDWDADNVAPSIGFAVGFLLGIQVLQFLAFALYSLRKGMFKRCCKEVGYLDETDYASDADFYTSSGLCCSVCGRGRASHDLVFN